MSVPPRSSLGRAYLHSAVLIFTLAIVSSTPSFHCPAVAILGSSVNLTCCIESSSNAHSYVTPNRIPSATCDLTDRCTPHGDYNAVVINKTCSVLTIPDVLQSHNGNWKCVVDADAPHPATCHVSASGAAFNITTPSRQVTGHPTTDGQDTDGSKCGLEHCTIPIAVAVAVAIAIAVVAIIIFIKRKRQEGARTNDENAEASVAFEPERESR